MSRSTSKPADWISLIEAAYNLEGSEQQWLDNVCDCADGVLDPSAVRLGYTNGYTPATHRLGLTHFPKIISPIAHLYYSSCDEQSMDTFYRQGNIAETLSSAPLPRNANAKKVFEVIGKILSSADFLGVVCATGTGESVTFVTLLKERRNPTALERKRWPQAAAHIGAGLRLRSKLRNLSQDELPVEAILDSQGRMHDGQGRAVERDARENLRELVLRIERARTIAGRSEPDDALDNWEALVDGRWSLVDRFDSDGKRYVIAVNNDPAHPDPRGLTAGERQVAEFAGLGRSTKQISYALGVSNSAVTNSTARIQEKLGLSSQVELVSFFSQAGLRRKLAEVAVEGERLLVGAYPLIDERWIKDLTEAERNVTAQILAGSTNADIAKRRDASEHTVANQVQAIFRKLEVRSRGELAARLQAGR